MALTTATNTKDPAGSTSLAGSGRWSALWGVGMLLVFVGERVIGEGNARGGATIAGLVLVVAAMGVRLARAGRAAPDRQRVERILLGLYALSLLSLLFYFAQSDLPTLRGGHRLEHTWPRLATTLGALWPALWGLAAWPILMVEMSYAQMAKAPRLESGRISDAMLSGFGMASALIFAFTVAYVASERDKKVDLAYFRTTRPGEVTRKIVRNLDAPLEISAFYPAGNEVGEEVDGYLKDLAKESAQLKITRYDFDINPAKAKEFNINANGTVVFVRGGRHEQLGLNMQMEQARGALRTLDKDVQQRLMAVVKPTRTAIVTQGHGERSWENPSSETDKRSGIKTLRDVLVNQSYDVRYVSAAEGLGQDVPKDASLLMILGPQKPFQPDELASINRYIDRGGRVFIALDPENGVDMKEVLEPLQLEYHAVTLANEQVFATKTHQDSDHANMVTNTYSSHPSVTTLTRLGGRAWVILPGCGWVNAKKNRPNSVTVDSPIKAHWASFEDKNGNFRKDPNEDKRAWEIGATAVKKDARVFVLADSDSLSDEVIRVAANELMALDIVHWLMGDETFQGVTSSEADVPISHTRKQDVGWFYGTTIVAPALIVGVGMTITRRVRRKKRAPAPPAAPRAEGGQS
jgi:hypothetical protein